MHMPPPSAEEMAQAIELGHEPSTVSVKGLMWFFVIFVLTGVIVYVVVWIVYRELVKYEETQDQPKSALVNVVQLTPPEPRLQPTFSLHETTEHEDLELMHGRENLEFIKRGWINKETGDFRIPDEVIEKVASGTAAAAPTANPASGGSGSPGR